MNLRQFASRMPWVLPVLALSLLALPAAAQGCGTSWQWTSPLPQGTDLRAIAAGGPTTVAVGDLGAVVTRESGPEWTPQVIAGKTDLIGLASSPEGFVAVTGTSFVLVSENGAGWRPVDTGTKAALQAAAWGGGHLVAVGKGGAILRSAKGRHWQEVEAVTASDLRAVAWGGQKNHEQFVAVGDAGTIVVSRDGRLWTESRALPVSLHGVAWGGSEDAGKWVAVGEAGIILTSADGAAWSPADSGIPYGLNAVVWGGTRFVAVGDFGTILSSCDGLAWSSTVLSPAATLRAVAFTGDQFVAVGESGTVATAAVAAAPTVSGVSPNSGTTAGNTNVTITGTGLTGATSVKFGTTPAASFVVNNDTQIAAFSPVHVTGTVDITVTTSGGTSATSSADQFTYVAGIPVVTGVSPTSGPLSGGTTVTITGAGFTGATAVQFGGTGATPFSVWSDGQIVVSSPARPAGTVDITVTTPLGTSGATSADRFTYGTAAPTVTGVVPSSGPVAGGTSVTVSGTNFDTAVGNTTVKFGANSATGVNVTSSSTLTCVSPAGSAATIDVVVTTVGGGASATSSADHFTYTSGPSVSSINPNTGSTSGGIQVTITGVGFTGATAVRFGADEATILAIDSDTQIRVTNPPHCNGIADVTVTTPSGTSAVTTADQFTYVANAPTVTNVSPAAGPLAGGTSVIIAGTNLFCATGVKFGTTAATFTVSSPTSITATSPTATSTGAVDVTVTTYAGTSATSSADQFTYMALPTVSAISPTTGPAGGGTTVTITGTGFVAPATVKFGSPSASNVVVVTATSITATSPAGTGTVDVTVTTAGGTSVVNANDKYTYISAPTVTGLSPTSGPSSGGTTVTVTGTGFVTGTSGTTVKFGANAATSVNATSATSLTCVSPPGSPGQVDVFVTTAGGTSAASTGSKYTYESIPTITSLTPTHGPAAGGTSVVIAGTNFTGATAVKFGSTNAANYTVNSGTQITATSPAGSGTVDVSVTTPNGTTSAGTATKYTYDPAPTIGSVTPSKGSTLGQTQITILGSGFVSGATVLLGATAATTVTVVNPATITAVTPAHSTGPTDVKVTNPDGQSATAAGAFTYISPPVVTSVKKLTDPFRLKIMGSNFHTNCTVRINGVAAPTTQFKESTIVFAKGGATLKAMLPKGVTVQITIVNNDDGISSLGFPYQR